MSALTTRQAARERLLRHLQAEVDRRIPADESIPIKGTTFLDFENLAEEASNGFYAALLEECLALSGQADIAPAAARCPYCSSPRLRQIGGGKPSEVRTPRGVVVINEQTFRCRNCSRSFSPSASTTGDAGASRSEPQGG